MRARFDSIKQAHFFVKAKDPTAQAAQPFATNPTTTTHPINHDGADGGRSTMDEAEGEEDEGEEDEDEADDVVGETAV